MFSENTVLASYIYNYIQNNKIIFLLATPKILQHRIVSLVVT